MTYNGHWIQSHSGFWTRYCSERTTEDCVVMGMCLRPRRKNTKLCLCPRPQNQFLFPGKAIFRATVEWRLGTENSAWGCWTRALASWCAKSSVVHLPCFQKTSVALNTGGKWSQRRTDQAGGLSTTCDWVVLRRNIIIEPPKGPTTHTKAGSPESQTNR